MSSRKRSPSPNLIITKRTRTTNDEPSEPNGSGGGNQMMVASSGQGSKGALIQNVKRTSGLEAPIMALTGHTGEILDLKFDPSGSNLASSSSDKTICLWKVYGDCTNYGILRGSKGGVTSIEWSKEGGLGGTSDKLFASTTANQMLLFNPVTGQLVRRYRSPRAILNTISLSPLPPHLVASGCDDGYVRIHSPDEAVEVDSVQIGHPVTSVEWLGGAGSEIAVGGIDNDVHVYDLRKKAVLYSLRAHQDTITSLRLSPGPNPAFLLSTAADSLTYIWDIRPFVPMVNQYDPSWPPRLVKTLHGCPAGFENWLRKSSWSQPGYNNGGNNDDDGTSVGGKSLIATGGADRSVTIWDEESGEIRYKLPGHKGTVIATDWSPREPIVASGGVDKTIFLGEVEVR